MITYDGQTGPWPYQSTPSAETRTGAPGSDPETFSMGNHEHPRQTSATYVTTAADGTAAVSFTRTFSASPTYSLNPVGSFGQIPPSANVTTWIMGSGPTAGLYVGANIKAMKPGTSAPLAAVTVLGISVAVGAQAVVPVFDNAGSVLFSCIFLQQS